MTAEQFDHIHDLIIKAMKENLTPAEGAELDTWQAKHPDNKKMMGQFMDPEFMLKSLEVSSNLDVGAAWAKVEAMRKKRGDGPKPNTNTTT